MAYKKWQNWKKKEYNDDEWICQNCLRTITKKDGQWVEDDDKSCQIFLCNECAGLRKIGQLGEPKE